MLPKVDKDGNSILINLGKIAEFGSIKDPEVNRFKPELLAYFLRELAHPDQIVSAGTGPEMAIQSFCKYNPVEVSRLAKGLLVDGQVDYRKEGERLYLNNVAVKYLNSGGLGMAGSVLMPSMMEHANGEGYSYHPETGMNISNGQEIELRKIHGRGGMRVIHRGSDESYQGLKSRGMTKLMESFYGNKCATKELWNPVGREGAFKALMEENQAPVALVEIGGKKEISRTVAVISSTNGMVNFQDPMEGDVSMPVKEFVKSAQAVSIQKER